MIKVINKSKDLIISHIADIDGLGAVVLARQIDPNMDYILVEVNDLPLALQDLVKDNLYLNYQKIYITDLAFRSDAINLVLNNSQLMNKIIHCDHHESEFANNKYPFINETIFKNNEFTCGTKLFHEYLLKNYLKEEYPTIYSAKCFSFVEGVRSRDTWDWKINGDRLGNDLTDMSTYMSESEFIDKYVECLKNDLNFFTEFDLKLINRRHSELAEYIEKCDNSLIKMELNGYNVGVSISELFRSEVGNQLSEKYENELDYILIANVPRGSYSLRTVKDDVNVGKIAHSFYESGGGHAKSAGCVINEKTIWILEKALKKYSEE